jgi:hypothetical protein
MKKIIILLLIITGFAASQALAQVSGKITFLYNGAVVDSTHFPNSTGTTGTFPGYINVSLIPANAAGIPQGGPVAILPASGVGISYASLNAKGEYTYSFSGVANGTYLVVPSFTNTITSARVTIGHYGAITSFGYGTPVVINSNTISNVNMYIDTRLAEVSVIAARNPTSANFAGSFTITAGFGNFPTGTVSAGNYMGIIGYLSPNGPGGMPDMFVQLSKPAVGNVAVFTGTGFFNAPLVLGTYNNVELGIFNSSTTLDSLTSYTANSGTFTIASGSNVVYWNADVSLAFLGIPQSASVKEPVAFNLRQNYPNPFNPSTTISYSLPTNTIVTLRLYDLLGHEVKTLVNGQQTAGEHAVMVNGSSLASGVYFYRLQAGNFTATKKMMLVK